MQTLSIEEIKNNGWLVFEVITGSKAYGLDTPASDTDIRGVFILPEDMFFRLEYTEQVNNETNDIVYYELKRFIQLLGKNNPNIMEMLSVPANCILHQHPVMDVLHPEIFLSKLCEQTFANYAYTQIKKAYGLEKKIVNPMDRERKTVVDFCFVYDDNQAVPLKKYLEERGMEENKIGLAAVAHLRDFYNLYYSGSSSYSGIMRSKESNDVCLSSIPKQEKAVGLLYFNKDGYSVYCKKYREYWDWVEKRNDERYKTTMKHGKNYDSKNMMHVFRLLQMAKEIAVEGRINVYRSDRDFLLAIKQGKYEYDDLVKQAEVLKNELPDLYRQSALPDEPDMEKINELLVTMRRRFYNMEQYGERENN